MSTRSRTRFRLRDDAGMATLEVAVLFPAVLILIFGIAQTALWYVARAGALAAAQQGLTAGRAYGAHDGDGAAAATSFLHEQVGDLLSGTQVAATSPQPGELQVTVSGSSLSVIPGWTISVSQSARGPIEAFTP